MEQPTFDFDSGALCLDFANTVDWHASEQPQDRLRDFDDLISWGKAAGHLDQERASHLRRLAQQQKRVATQAFARTVALREALFRIFSGEPGEEPADDLSLLNRTVSQAFPHLRLASTETGYAWRWQDDPEAMDQVIWPVVRSAAELLTSDQLDRVRRCADDRGCGYLFIDTSRNRSRRWCSMESCGNRAKARRHYRRISGEKE